MLLENSLYTNQAEKEELLKDRTKIADSLIYNYFGFISLFSAIPRKDVKQWKNNELKVRLDNITDDNTDVSLSVKLAYEAKLIPKSTVDKLTRLLALFKQGKITKAKDINDDLIHDLFVLCKFDSVNKPSPRIMPVVKDYIEREINIAYLARDLYRFSRSDKDIKLISTEFRNMFKNSGYVQVYSAFENGHTKLSSGVPQKYIKTITDKTIIHQVKKVVDGSSVGITANTTSTGVDQIIDAVNSTLEKTNVQTPVVKIGQTNSTQNSQGGINFSGITVDSRDKTTDLNKIGQSVTYNNIDLGLNKKIDDTLDGIENGTPSEPDEDEVSIVTNTNTDTTAFTKEIEDISNDVKNKEIEDQINKDIQPEKEFNPYHDESDFNIENGKEIGYEYLPQEQKYRIENYSEKTVQGGFTSTLASGAKERGIDLSSYLKSVDDVIIGFKEITLSKGLVNGSALVSVYHYLNIMNNYIALENIERPEFFPEFTSFNMKGYYKKPNGEFTKLFQALVFVAISYALQEKPLFNITMNSLYDHKNKGLGFGKLGFKSFFTGGAKGAKSTIELINKHRAKINFNKVLSEVTTKNNNINKESRKNYDEYAFLYSIFDVFIGEEGSYIPPKEYGMIGDILAIYKDYALYDSEELSYKELNVRDEVVDLLISRRSNLIEDKDITLSQLRDTIKINIFDHEKYIPYYGFFDNVINHYVDYFTDFKEYISDIYPNNTKQQIVETIVNNSKLSDDDIYECVIDSFLNNSAFTSNMFITLTLYMNNKPTYPKVAKMSDIEYYKGLNRIIKATFKSVLYGKYNYSLIGKSNFSLLKITHEKRYDKSVITDEIHDEIIKNMYTIEGLGQFSKFVEMSKITLLQCGDVFKLNSSSLTNDLIDSLKRYFPMDNIAKYLNYLPNFFETFDKVMYLNSIHNNIYDVTQFESIKSFIVESIIEESKKQDKEEFYNNLLKLNQKGVPYSFCAIVYERLKSENIHPKMTNSLQFTHLLTHINEDEAIDYFEQNPEMMQSLKHKVLVNFTYDTIKVDGGKNYVTNKKSIRRFTELYLTENYSEDFPFTIDLLESSTEYKKLVNLLKYCSPEFLAKNVDINSIVELGNSIEDGELKDSICNIITQSNTDVIDKENVKIALLLNTCIKNPTLYKNNKLYSKILNLNNNINTDSNEYLFNDYVEYVDEIKNDLSKNIFDDFSLEEIYNMDEKSKSSVLISKAKEEYEEVLIENIQNISSILENTQFDVMAGADDDTLVNVAKINGIGINSLHKNIDTSILNKQEFLNYINTKLRNDFKNDIESYEAMPIVDIESGGIDETNSEEVLIEYSKKLYETSNGLHGDVAPLVNKVYNISMDRSKFDNFVEKDRLNPNSESKGNIRTFMFHGTGSVAVTFISKFGFREIPEGVGIAIAGKMLGSGIYLAENIDKSLSYIGDSGFEKSYKEGYIFEVDVCLGEFNVDFVDHRNHPNLRSPEWCIRDFESQILVKRIYKLKSVPVDVYKARLKNSKK